MTTKHNLTLKNHLGNISDAACHMQAVVPQKHLSQQNGGQPPRFAIGGFFYVRKTFLYGGRGVAIQEPYGKSYPGTFRFGCFLSVPPPKEPQKLSGGVVSTLKTGAVMSGRRVCKVIRHTQLKREKQRAIDIAVKQFIFGKILDLGYCSKVTRRLALDIYRRYQQMKQKRGGNNA